MILSQHMKPMRMRRLDQQRLKKRRQMEEVKMSPTRKTTGGVPGEVTDLETADTGPRQKMSNTKSCGEKQQQSGKKKNYSTILDEIYTEVHLIT
ncbi:uncharacterized protein LOC105353859 [Oryzias latipes]|uniref:uncharacterized protein LOC105353859 n=1 Tax=Oryzias latipes TaxID=8090 RepID=UPI000CE21172|nr:uncharacterized protein LOC105353859 [Oryzias latipes]